MSLWVVLMVPVSVFAAVVAMAGPQRLAAESSVDATAEDLALLAVAWRDGHGRDGGALPAFPPECESSVPQQQRLEDLDDDVTSRSEDWEELNEGLSANPPTATQEDVADARARVEAAERARFVFGRRLRAWTAHCERVFRWILGDLGHAGINTGSLRGFYSGALTTAPTTDELPCKVSETIEVRDAVHVALVADWEHAGWAAAQVWPAGVRMGAESIGRLRRTVSGSELEECGRWLLEAFDDDGRPVWLRNWNASSRRLLQSDPPGRTLLEG